MFSGHAHEVARPAHPAIRGKQSSTRTAATIVSSITLLCVANAAAADSVQIEPTRDAAIYAPDIGTVANGSGQHLFVGRNSGGNTRRSLLFFDIAAAIPEGATITSATLDVSVSSTSGGATSVNLHRLLSDWGEGPSDPPGSEGGGATALAGDTTWSHAFYETTPWSTPGGDFDPAPAASTIIDQPGDYTFASTPSLVAHVQLWLDDPASNLGWIVLGDEVGFGTAKRLDSRQNPDESVRPTLTVTYTPAPASTSALFLSALAATRRRRHKTPPGTD